MPTIKDEGKIICWCFVSNNQCQKWWEHIKRKIVLNKWRGKRSIGPRTRELLAVSQLENALPRKGRFRFLILEYRSNCYIWLSAKKKFDSSLKTKTFMLFPSKRYCCFIVVWSGNLKRSGKPISLATFFGEKFRKWSFKFDWRLVHGIYDIKRCLIGHLGY